MAMEFEVVLENIFDYRFRDGRFRNSSNEIQSDKYLLAQISPSRLLPHPCPKYHGLGRNDRGYIVDPMGAYRIVTHAVHNARKQEIFRRHHLDDKAIPIKNFRTLPNVIVNARIGG